MKIKFKHLTKQMDIDKQNRVADLHAKFAEFKKYEQLNNNAVDEKWRSILSTEKNQQQKLSIDKIRANYTKQLDRCDAVIHRLLQWLNEGESQYQFALRAHKQNLQLLTELSNKRSIIVSKLTLKQLQMNITIIEKQHFRHTMIILLNIAILQMQLSMNTQRQKLTWIQNIEQSESL